MPHYKAPLRDIHFALREMTDFQKIQSLTPFQDVTDDVVDAVLNEGAKFAETVLFPINRSGDEEGCHYENGTVRTPKGFKEAYNQFVEGGWSSLSSDPAYGGQGLPESLGIILEELICSANNSFGLYPGLTRGAYLALHAHGSEELKQKYLPNLVSGKWGGTMNLTEPHCGTDLGMLRTKAEPQGDGSYKITGTKIFISSGEHDLTENIIHLVLARTPDAPTGTKGISLFLVPKFMVKEDGSLGERNGVSCASIEHKMGIKASSTCVMNYDGATGYLVGELNKGLNHMFTMMNVERLAVGGQGLGLSEVSYQAALAYARERVQGRALTGAKYPDKAADPLMVHPDIRRTLLTMRAYTEGCRMMSSWVAHHIDISHHSDNDHEKQASEDLIHLLTPIVKAFFTDIGYEVANMAVQVHGGFGYIREYGVEQYVRDARIAQIYEGTNGIQALDLVGRKLGMHFGRPLRQFFHPVMAYLEDHKNHALAAEFILPLVGAVGALQKATLTMAGRGMANPDEAGAAATDYLAFFGHVAVGYMWSRAALYAQSRLGRGEDDFYKGKLKTARFYMQKLMPKTRTYYETIMAGAKSVMDIQDSEFGPFDFIGSDTAMAKAG
jgi:alkylation response protein AidB-like acyl-CoA dehydrogenase